MLERMEMVVEGEAGMRAAVVVYYLSRNGQLEHPHLMEVPFSSSTLLSLKDVLNRLTYLRGEGMRNMYSWSSKRSYRNGFVWQDLTENDFIYPTNGHDEYVLKGTLLIQPSHTLTSFDDTLSSDADHADSSSSSTTAVKVYTANACTNAANASTQTDNKNQLDTVSDNNDGISISTSCSGSGSGDIRNQKMEIDRPSGRIKASASALVMHFIRCRSSSMDYAN
ncbi:protein SOSEKI 4-like [Arachis stenosperma]|uniref:protein SOSEKI 4-like n=1 Tax=Arachis stenosperma TaxID=217475 RepID=UPI0025ACF1C1|nr:protein SOSEKI 4-like [Arachis stenosperma]